MKDDAMKTLLSPNVLCEDGSAVFAHTRDRSEEAHGLVTLTLWIEMSPSLSGTPSMTQI